MKILEGELGLREETRALEQAREALEAAKYSERATPLANTQEELAQRVVDVTKKIRELPEGEAKFQREIALLTRVEQVMQEARELLGRPTTGAPTIAAETEAIELLLQTRRSNPKGGGGGGASPGGGGSGTTEDSALALLGSGTAKDAKVDVRPVGQATGVSGTSLPEEFRTGLDAYFDALEGNREAAATEQRP